MWVRLHIRTHNDEDHSNDYRRSAPITSRIRSIPTEVVLTEEDGLPATCAANFDKLQTVPKGNVGERISHLTTRKLNEAAKAISFAPSLFRGRRSGPRASVKLLMNDYRTPARRGELYPTSAGVEGRLYLDVPLGTVLSR
jgi:hypothetical protein